MSQKKIFNDGWYFAKQAVHSPLSAIKSGNITWEAVSLPHDWLIYDTANLYETGDGWYKKSFVLSEVSEKKRILLRFEGIYMDSAVYVNGITAGTWKYGYSTFEFDITSLVKKGENEVLVQVTYESPNSRWYSGAGIYRNVWLKTVSESAFVSDGIYISTKNLGEYWMVNTDSTISLAPGAPSDSSFKLRQSILDNKGALVAREELLLSQDKLQQGKCTLKVSKPRLWDLESPVLYQLKSQLIAGPEVIDEEVQTFGLRTIKFSSQEGFFLNERHVILNGVCEHHDLGCLGAAVNKAALRRRFNLLQEMGVNAIRTSHNMPSVEFMELADEMGVLVISEAFDMWERKKTDYDYARFFPEWAGKDVKSWICRDRNHPSLIMWSIGNEIYDTHADQHGQEITAKLRDMVLAYDPEGNGAVTIGSNYMPWENAQKCADILKFAGYNYGEKYYDLHHKEHPDWIIYGSETSSTVQSRGIYHFPLSQSVLSDDDEQCSSLGNSSTSWGAKNTESCIIAHRDAPYTLGQFIWTGFDYIGEPTPYFTKNSYFGQLDTAGFKKDSYYIYQAEWTDYKTSPMIHIFPYWDFSEGQLIDIRVCSNSPKIELFFNRESLGAASLDHLHGTKLLGEWRLPYTKGILKAVAYDEKNNPIAQDVKSSFGDAASLKATADKYELNANGSDLVFLEISVLDKDGIPVENANNRVAIGVEGPGVLVGLDNGDSTDYDQYKGNSRRLFNGKLLAVLSGTFTPGTITVTVSSKGMESEKIVLKSLYGDQDLTGCCEPLPCPSSESNGEIPIRKLEIISPNGNRLNKENSSLPIQVKIHPENATYDTISWRVANASGASSNIAALTAEGKKAVLTALGDGTFYVRCSCKNGSQKTHLYSQLEFQVSGLGKANLNPYEFISGCSYTSGSPNLTNGNDRGVATSREEKSVIVFERIDFGEYGSDEITLPVFSLDSGEFSIELWEGTPGKEKASLITAVTYQKPSIWNVYQEETYHLPKRLRHYHPVLCPPS